MFNKTKIILNTMSNCLKISRGIQTQKIYGPARANTFGASTAAVESTIDLEANRLVWIDMEMTGLNVEEDKIMEVACIVTDSELAIVAEAPTLIIHHPPEVLDNMGEWCLEQHSKTGLIDECLQSKLTVEEVENTLLEFVTQHTTEKFSPLAGSTVYMDRIFLKKFMPRVDEHLHYRIIDVSTIKELCRRWNPDLHRCTPKKEFNHRALQDIRESIEELKFYKEHFFKDFAPQS